MKDYRKKPVVIQAMQFDGSFESANAIQLQIDGRQMAPYEEWNGVVEIETLEGTMRADPGDWIIKGVKGEFYPCKPDIFAATYDAAGTLPTLEYEREVLDHRVEGKGGGADDTRIFVLDQPGQGGACHKYAVTDGRCKVLMFVDFQNGPIQEVGINGVQQEHLLAIVIDRLRSFQAGPFAGRYNEKALGHCEEALMWLQRRTVDRIRRGVEGFNKA